MKKGVYVNLKLDRADLVYHDGKKLHLHQDLTYDDFDVRVDLDLELQNLEMTFINLEYLGDL
jgi:hypothetical protein